MGVRNSSNTRVVPIFDALFGADATGASWLGGLLQLGSRSRAASVDLSTCRLIEGHRRTWGVDELALPAPLGLLEHLVQNITAQQVAASGDSGLVLAKRQALANGDSETVEEALILLRSGRRGRRWFVLEGPSRPDATLEMPTAVVVIEGKRTERACTSTTKWMSQRSQLLRHMDAAAEFFPGKRILGLLLVEGDGSGDTVHPSDYWRLQSEAQCSEGMLAASLPHRTGDQRAGLAQGILGVATWQAVCSRYRIPWPPSNDTA
jgi:hypothetical protein